MANGSDADGAQVRATLALVSIDPDGTLRRVAFSPFTYGSGRRVSTWTRLDLEHAG